MGHPRRVKPTSDGYVGQKWGEGGVSFLEDGEGLGSVEVESLSIMWSAAARSPGEPTRVPMLRYHAFKARPGMP